MLNKLHSALLTKMTELVESGEAKPSDLTAFYKTVFPQESEAPAPQLTPTKPNTNNELLNKLIKETKDALQ